MQFCGLGYKMLKLNDIHTYYGESYILQGVSLKIGERAVVGLLGRNGVGKTTTINSIMGFTPPERGKIYFNGVDITKAPSHRIAQMGIGIVPQGKRIFSSLSVEENLTFASQKKEGGWDLEKIYFSFPILRERSKHKGNELSGGEQQMLVFARALLRNPDLILMDEPSEGLAPLLIDEIIRLIRQLKDEGFPILLVEQNLSMVLRVADYVYIMTKGKIVHETTPEELRKDEKIQATYLGVTVD
jgi:branched-chain amino acid transport system ATP-binding protein